MSRFSLRILAVAFLALALVLGYFSAKMWYKRFQVSERKGGLDSRIAELNDNIAEIEGRLNIFFDPDLIEGEAKARLHLRRPEEKVVIVVPEEGNVGAEDVPQANSGEEIEEPGENENSLLANPQRWWDYFFSR